MMRGIDVEQMTPEEVEAGWETMTAEERDDAFRENLQAAISAHTRVVTVYTREGKATRKHEEKKHKVLASSWRASWKDTHSSKAHRLGKALTAQERATVLLGTKEWKGSEVAHGTYFHRGFRENKQGLRLRHSSGAQCILWETA